jgi:histidine triad (HIT) family protein
MSECVFCAIVQGRAPASMVYQDDAVAVFLDIAPITPGHLLVVPTRHVVDMSGLDEETGAHLFKITMQMAQAVRGSGVECEGINLLLADGEAAGQEVFHVHMHVVPRYKGDGFEGEGFGIPTADAPRRGRQELDKIASAIRSVLQKGDPASKPIPQPPQ